MFFFFNDTATTEIYTLSLHDALPILDVGADVGAAGVQGLFRGHVVGGADHGALHGQLPLLRVVGLGVGDRKSTRLNSSHGYISYAVFCLKKKKKENL